VSRSLAPLPQRSLLSLANHEFHRVRFRRRAILQYFGANDKRIRYWRWALLVIPRLAEIFCAKARSMIAEPDGIPGRFRRRVFRSRE
jgi:hypothetical protein